MTAYYSGGDADAETRVAAAIERALRCQVVRFGGKFSPIDFYALRDGRLVAWIEVKTRSRTAFEHATVFMAFRKYLTLRLAESGSGLPALFVVAFADETRWIRACDVDARAMRVGGRADRPDDPQSIEPGIAIPVASMHRLAS